MRNLLKGLLSRMGYRITRTTNTEFFRFESLICCRMEQVREFNVVQIGACDGIYEDPVRSIITRYRRRVKAYLIEPLPDIYEKLVENYYGYENVTTLNVAIHESVDEIDMYRVDPRRIEEAPSFAMGISSFDPDHHKKSRIPQDLIVSESVRCRPLSWVIDQFRIPHVDLLQIDAEGYDAEIIKSIDFASMAPSIIRFEHGLASGILSVDEFDQVSELLHRNHYELAFLDSDAVAYRRELTLSIPPN